MPFVERNGAAAVQRQTEIVALHVTGLSKQYPGVTALEDLSLSIKVGQVYGLVGQNGAGKSTLINVLSGMVRADRGTIAVRGTPVSIGSTREAQKLGIATVYQELSLLPNLSVEQNLVLGREPRRRGLLDVAAMRRAAEAALSALDLTIDPAMPVGRLSLAERQMIEIAKALATDPAILILDEPTAPLGKSESERLFATIARLKARGVAIIYVSHRFAEVLQLCDVATVLRNGREVVTTSLAGWSEARLTEAMIGGQSQLYRASQRQATTDALRAEGIASGRHVQDVSLRLRRGEIVVLTGLLGAGQNEIARVLGGDLMPDRGRLFAEDREIRLGSPHDAVESGICLLTEDRKGEGILPNRSVRENIAIGSLRRRRIAVGLVDSVAETKAIGGASRDYGVVAASIEAPIRTLSGGNQQKALLARWHVATAETFILIEPTRGVDVGARADIYRRLDALARAGKAVLVVSSDLPEVLAIADRILVVRDGRISAETTPVDTDEEGLNLLVQGVAA